MTLIQPGTDLAGDLLTVATEKLVRRAHRATSTSTTTTTIGVLGLYNVPLQVGYGYDIRVKITIRSSVAADGITPHIRYTTHATTPATPTTSSTVLPDGLIYCRVNTAAAGETHTFEAYYVPAADEVISLLLCITRAAGTGNIDSFADASTPTTIKVYNVGEAVADTGTDI